MTRLLAVIVVTSLAGAAVYYWEPASKDAPAPNRIANVRTPTAAPADTGATPTPIPEEEFDSLPETPAAAPASPPSPAASPASPAAPRHVPTESALQQTGFFESSEPLPPGVAFPESSEAPPANSKPATAPGPQLSPLDANESAGPAPLSPPALITPPSRPAGESIANESEFHPLITRDDLSGWVVQEGKVEAWQVHEGVLDCLRANGGWLRTAREFSDFELRFDVRLSQGANTGVGLRFPESGSPSLNGIEVQLIDDAAEKYATLRPDQYTGSLYYQSPPLEPCTLSVNDWHAVSVLVLGSRVQVVIDGRTVNDVQFDQLPAGEDEHALCKRPPLGFVGFQSSASLASFRNIRIRDLATHAPSGLATVDLATGTGEVCPRGARVTVDYCGRFIDGRKFDSSFDRGEPLTVDLADVIAGWQEGLPGMRVGGRRKLIVPAELAYGDEGVKDLVPPGARLVFEVELRRVER